MTCNNEDLGFLRSYFDRSYFLGWGRPLSGEANVLTIPRPNEWDPNGPSRASTPLIAYFECYGDYYNIQIRSREYLGSYLGGNIHNKLGANIARAGKATPYNLLNDDKTIITLDNIESDNATIYLKARDAGIIKRNKKIVNEKNTYYFNDSSGELLKFNLKILERNVDYPTDSEPYDLNAQD